MEPTISKAKRKLKSDSENSVNSLGTVRVPTAESVIFCSSKSKLLSLKIGESIFSPLLVGVRLSKKILLLSFF